MNLLKVMSLKSEKIYRVQFNIGLTSTKIKVNNFCVRSSPCPCVYIPKYMNLVVLQE